jgi:hypothetical protein
MVVQQGGFADFCGWQKIFGPAANHRKSGASNRYNSCCITRGVDSIHVSSFLRRTRWRAAAMGEYHGKSRNE